MLKILKIRYSITSLAITLIVSLYFAVVLNATVLLDVHSILQQSGTPSLGLEILVALIMFFVINILFSLFSIKYIQKPAFIILLIVSSITSYMGYYYKIIFNSDTIMNIVQTNYNEAISYFNFNLLLWVFIFGVIPSLIICRAKITHHSPIIKDILLKLTSIIVSVVAISIILSSSSGSIVALGRNHSHLKKNITPTYLIYSTIKYIKNSTPENKLEYKQLGLDAKNVSVSKNGKNNLLVLVVGETARSANYQLNGYSRKTNKHTENTSVISFENFTSCGTSTAISVPCLFSNMKRTNFNANIANNQDNLLDIANRAGLNVLWLDNNSGCKGVCDKVNNIEFSTNKNNKYCDGTYCFDEVLLEGLQSRIDGIQGKDSILILHVIGSHGPTYFKRYPKDHKYFIPDCPISDIHNCSPEELMNTYDNTILYTDFILSKIIALLKENKSTWNTSLVYFSDHGESLGEHGLYLHGLPYKLAPKEQTHIPLVMWLSDNFSFEKGLSLSCLNKAANKNSYSHDNIFHSVLGIMDIQTDEYKQKLDLFAKCRDLSLNN